MEETPTRAALLVDFDNIYLGLEATEPQLAEAFARHPEHWLDVLHAVANLGGGGPRKRVLLRRCYLNPASFGRYRTSFVRAGFTVIDCPPLTIRGKTSTDMLIAVDVMKALDHPSNFDEFVLMSGDADFTPLLQEVRLRNRFSTVITAGPMAAALAASCDQVLTVDSLLHESARLQESGGPMAPPRGRWATIASATIASKIAESNEPVSSATMAAAVAKALKPHGFATWSEFGDFKSFVSQLDTREFAVDWAVPGRFTKPRCCSDQVAHRIECDAG